MLHLGCAVEFPHIHEFSRLTRSSNDTAVLGPAMARVMSSVTVSATGSHASLTTLTLSTHSVPGAGVAQHSAHTVPNGSVTSRVEGGVGSGTDPAADASSSSLSAVVSSSSSGAVGRGDGAGGASGGGVVTLTAELLASRDGMSTPVKSRSDMSARDDMDSLGSPASARTRSRVFGRVGSGVALSDADGAADSPGGGGAAGSAAASESVDLSSVGGEELQSALGMCVLMCLC